jgi:manganese transport protein
VAANLSRGARIRIVTLLGPAFVAAIAYVDPGNVAANVTAGARYGFLLVWVLVASNAIAVLVQYLSAKLGIVTHRSLPELLGTSLRRPARLAFWAQAELIAMATDLAEVIGGAIALNLLFGVPLVIGGVITGVVSLVILATGRWRGRRVFEGVIVSLLVVLALGFCAGLLVAPPHAGALLGGLVPRLAGTDTVLLAASMLGATVMPHAIYLHSALARDGIGRAILRVDAAMVDRKPASPEKTTHRYIVATRWDVGVALVLAGGVNIAMLVVAADALAGRAGTDSIAGAYGAIHQALGSGIATLFAVGLLASGLASTSVGAYAGAEVMAGLLRVRVPMLARRAVTLVPAIVLLAIGMEPTRLLVLSQVALSFGIPFAAIPLVVLTRRRAVLGEHRNAAVTQVLAWLAVGVIVVLNAALLVLLVVGR